MKKVLMILIVISLAILSCTKEEAVNSDKDLVLKQAELLSLSATIDAKQKAGMKPELFRNEAMRYNDLYSELSKKGNIQPLIKFAYADYRCQNFNCSFAVCCRVGTCHYITCPRCGSNVTFSYVESCD